MGWKDRMAIVLFGCCAMLGLLAAGLQAGQKTGASYDGHWWLSISLREQSGFLNGYYDCYHYDYKGPAEFSQRPLSLPEGVPIPNLNLFAAGLIASFYKAHPQSLDLPVTTVLYSFRDLPGEKARDNDGDGEVTRGRHGFYDGTYWKQISALGGKAEQRGFVEGSLWCRARVLQGKGGVFSKTAAEYTALITRWYGFVEDTGDINGKREPAKIADVLSRFRDRPQ